MTSTDFFGPFTPGIPDAERMARSRCLAGVTRLCAGPAAAPVLAALHRLERDPAAAAEALILFDRLPSRPRRNALSTYLEIHSIMETRS